MQKTKLPDRKPQ